MEGLKELANALSNGNIPDPLRPPLPQPRPPLKTSISVISGMGKATDFKFCQYIPRIHQNKSPLKILEEKERGCIQGLPNFYSTPYYLGNG